MSTSKRKKEKEEVKKTKGQKMTGYKKKPQKSK